MKPKAQKKVTAAASDAMRGLPSSDSLLGKSEAKSVLDDINGNAESATSNVGSYTPTEFPLEAKLMSPSYALEPASPSSEIESFMAQSKSASINEKDTEATSQPSGEFEFGL